MSCVYRQYPLQFPCCTPFDRSLVYALFCVQSGHHYFFSNFDSMFWRIEQFWVSLACHRITTYFILPSNQALNDRRHQQPVIQHRYAGRHTHTWHSWNSFQTHSYVRVSRCYAQNGWKRLRAGNILETARKMKSENETEMKTTGQGT